jgi:hypothetical protein
MSPYPKKEKFRKEWIGIFEKEIYPIINTFEIEYSYAREEGCEEQNPAFDIKFKYR